eukprot:1604096-Pleurochrysis_carterae.AAC.1
MCVCTFAKRAHQHAPPLRLVRALPGLRVSWRMFAHALKARVQPSPARARVRACPCARASALRAPSSPC